MQAQNEVAVLALLDHPNIVRYYECFAEQGTKVKIVMELCEVHMNVHALQTQCSCPSSARLTYSQHLCFLKMTPLNSSMILLMQLLTG